MSSFYLIIPLVQVGKKHLDVDLDDYFKTKKTVKTPVAEAQPAEAAMADEMEA